MITLHCYNISTNEIYLNSVKQVKNIPQFIQSSYLGYSSYRPSMIFVDERLNVGVAFNIPYSGPRYNNIKYSEFLKELSDYVEFLYYVLLHIELHDEIVVWN